MSEFRRMLGERGRPVVAPLVFNPLTAKLAEAAGFKALYLGGGSMGYLKCVTEANLSLTEMVQAGVDIRTVCRLPLILDGACGWGDPMHQLRTIGMAEAAGFCAIEIEDQILPKRAHHHIGIEHIVPTELMAAKVREAVAARQDPDFVIIARTNAARMHGLDEALRRGEAYRKAGADMLFVLQKSPEEVRAIGERLGGPLLYMPLGSRLGALPFGLDELASLGYRLIVDAVTPLLAAHRALRQSYAAMARGEPDPLIGSDPAAAREEQEKIHEAIGLVAMLDIERRTVER
jgi:2-methylisocitrate lyase-like PEP mutase family enzyme